MSLFNWIAWIHQWDDYLTIIGSCVFLLLNFVWCVIVWRADRYKRQGYQELNAQVIDRKVTYLEGGIYFLTLVQWSTVLLLVVLSLVSQLNWKEWLFHTTLLAGWGFQYLLVHQDTKPQTSAPRYRFVQYVIHMVIQVYYLQYQQTFVDSLFSILNNLSLAAPGLLFFLEVINPGKDSKSDSDDERAGSLEHSASIFSRITYTWVNPLLTMGYSKLLEQEDVPHLIRKDRMKNIIKEWDKYKVDGNSVVYDSIRFTKWYAVWQLSLAIMTTTLDFSKPFFINLLLNWIQYRKDGEDNSYGYFLLGGMFVSSLLKQILESQINLSGRHWGIQLRAVFVYEIFKKSLHRTGGASLEDDEGKASQGKIVSLMSNDTNQVRWFLTDIHSTLIDIPLSLVISISGLLYIMGPPALAGLAVMIISGPISSWAATRLYKILKVTRAMVDRRIQVTNEALQGIRIIKYMAWEPQFIKKICDAREDELRSRLQLLMSNALVNSSAWASSILVTFTSFFFYTIVAGKQLDAATAFTSISLLETVSYTLSGVSEMVSEILNIRVTMSRINSFLKEEELEKYTEGNPQNMDKNCEVAIKNGVFVYHGSQGSCDSNEETPLLSDQEGHTFRLKGINIQFPKNQLSVIVGATGSGKTSILLTLLGEMKRIEGCYNIPEHHLNPESLLNKSDVVYAPQTPWLMSASIRDNILLGEEYDEGRYYRVVKACALLKDLDNLEYGDNTAVGEKGGGQKARVSLARAAYSRAPIVLLDDPLSAVDAPTARYLLQNCILGLFRGRTVILVTHAVQLVLPHAQHVVVMKNGSILSQGTPHDVTKDQNVNAIVANEAAVSQTLQELKESNLEVSQDVPLKSKEPEDHKEGKASGSVKWKTYKAYLVACGGFLFVFGVLLSFAIQTSADYLSNWWVEVWTDSLQKSFSVISYSHELFVHSLMNFKNQVPIVKEYSTQNESLFYISIFGLIGFVELFALLFKIFIQFYGGIRASRMMHSKLVVSVLGSPMRFFETTPVGRIINRFTKDLSDIDLTVMFTIFRFATTLLGAFVRLILVSVVTPPFAFAFLLTYFYWLIAKYYLTTSRELKRIESVSNSPIYALFGESLNGTSTIRAYGAENQFLRKIEKRVDANHRAYFYLFATNQWLMFRTALLSCCIVLCAGVSILVSGLTAGWAGVAFNFSSQVTNMIANAIRTHSSLEMAMNAVERVEEYAKLKQEIIQGSRPLPPNWPSEGKVLVKNLVVRYAPELPDVLKSVSFSIQPKEKIGIVGRTGAGKSTLSMAFFRILEAVSGSIIIDDIDISELGVRDLRSRLTIIPQDPVLFEGTLRSNLDPLGEHSDDSIWDALRLTHVLESFQTNESTQTISLDNVVNENGSNFSQGQRQLLCLARALLRQSKFIFLDEATASVDPETDAKIQQTFRTEFSSGTILTVAHRLKTIMDYDKVLVLDQGMVREMGTPMELLNKKGMFYEMCQESGEYQDLLRMAKK